ncbi:hypothetical protein [Staphylococcus equorum]|uniref:Uncharacterized protein n=1 Tax=Staphylococcus equorum TaxID=246432 RepID=A0AAP7IFH6_9STAP|nr:hypothetical protein [Staphylococcus equorum]OEK58957.1 hypothetical protein ASS94_01120 [Staphylococcus equorum]
MENLKTDNNNVESKKRNQQIVQEVYKVVAPLIEKIESVEDTSMFEYQLDAICEDLTEEQNNMLDEMLEV